MPGWHHYGAFKPRPCIVCEESFTPKSGVNKFCSPQCKGKWKYITGSGSTENQYKKISGNWDKYFARLLCRKERKNLTKRDLLFLLEKQGGRCALSGVKMTCVLEKGKHSPDNASIDRINAGGDYTIDNVQLVCAVVNKWRSNTPIDVFVEYCERIANWKSQKEI